MDTNTERIAWVDVFKFLGIWAIYIGHFGDKGGRVYPFVFTYHVPMFFFAAGFFAARSLKDAPLPFIKKKTMQLMVPYVFFSLSAIIFFTLQDNLDILQAKSIFLPFVFGIRDQLIAGSLWFIPCLYWMVIGDYFVNKIFNLRAASLLVSIGTFLISQTLLQHNPAHDPSWFMNLDSALFYYIYYALGAALFPFISKSATTTIHRLINIALVLATFTITVLTFFQTSAWLFGKIAILLPALSNFKLSVAFYEVFIALAIIYLNTIVAKLFAHVSLLGELGRETLIFCGTEDVTKGVITQMLAMINLKARLINPFVTIIFSLICLLVSKYTFVRFLNTYFPWAVGKANLPLAASDNLDNEINSGRT